MEGFRFLVMSNVRVVIKKASTILLPLFLLLGFKTIDFPALAYDSNYAHPALTEEVAKLFNGKNSSDKKINGEEINWLKQGSIDEDEPARWINHFYDPVNKVGWTGKHLGYMTAEEGYKTGSSLAPKPAIASVDWATNQQYQAAYGRQFGNQTWQKAIKSYLDGDRQTAFLALGHILHLVEDASVPDHTRDDSHPGILLGDPGSPYESYSKEFNKDNKLSVADDFLKGNIDLLDFNKIQDAFDRLANYSNNNFFSEDTINNDDFNYPNVKELKNVVLEKNGRKSMYLFDGRHKSYLAVFKPTNKFSTDDPDFVLPSYREHLFPQAVLTGASVLQLFFKEVEKYRAHPELLETITPDNNVPLSTTIMQWPVRTAIKICDSGSFCNNVANAVGGVRVALQSTVTSLLDQIKNNTKLTWFSNTPSSNPSTAVAPVLTTLAGPVTDKPKRPFVPLADIIKESASNPAPALASNQPIETAPSDSKIISVVSPTISKPITNNPVIFYPPSSPTTDSSSTPAPSAVIISPQSPSSVVGGSVTPPPASGNTTIGISNLTPTGTPTSSPAPTVNLLNQPKIYQSSLIYTSSTVTISGTVSSSATSVLAFESDGVAIMAATTSVSLSSSTWQFVPILKNGHNYFYFGASSTDATSTLAGPIDIIYDINPPSIPVIKFLQTDTNLQVSVTSSDQLSSKIFYDIDYRTSTDWQSIATKSSSSTFAFSGTRGQTYFVRGRARDELNNISDWSTSSLFINWMQEVVINEVAWAGTSASYPYDEWFELYNNTDQPIDIKNWKITVSGKPISYNKINNSIIASRGYLLLKRSREDSIYGITGDIIYSNADGFNNKQGEKLEIFKPSGEKTDEVDCSKGWFAGDSTLYRTMERISPTMAGNIPANWQSNQGPRPLARSYNGGYIYGSPRQSNFGNIVLTDRQLDPVRTLTKEDSPYILETYIIPAGYTLNIAPGVVVKSYYPWSNFDVSGNLIVGSETGEPVTFTSGRDTNFPDQRNASVVGNWSTSTPSPKDWQGFWFRPSSTGKFYNTNIQYAGKEFRLNGYIYTDLVSETIFADGSDLVIKNSRINNNGAVALHAENSNVNISGSNFKDGDRAIETLGSAVSVSDTGFGGFTNASGPLYIKDNWPNFVNLSFENNFLNLPYLISITIKSNAEIKVPIYLNNLSVAKGATLNILSGSAVHLARYSTIEVQGSLKALGTAEAPITIQGLTTSTQWGNINFVSSTSILSNVVMKGGGLLTSYPVDKDGMLLLDSSDLTINNSILYDARAPGSTLRAKNSRLYIGNSSFGLSQKPSFQTTGISAAGGEMLLDNLLFTNMAYGIYSDILPLPTTTFSNITPADFVNVDHPTFPSNWIPPEIPVI